MNSINNMEKYNSIMIKFWLFMGIAIAAFTTYKGFTEGFENWKFFYVFAGLAFFAYFMRKWMVKRFEKTINAKEEKEK